VAGFIEASRTMSEQAYIHGRPDAALKAELDKYQILKDALSAEDIDTQTILDTLEGETNLHEMLQEVVDSALDDEDLAATVGERIKRLQARKSRLETTAEHKRNLIIMIMERAGLENSKGAVATLSVRQTKPKLVVEDEALIPSRFFVPADPKLDKDALKAALDANEQVPGAKLSNGGVTLTVRVK
jgi:hypothetical protein